MDADCTVLMDTFRAALITSKLTGSRLRVLLTDTKIKGPALLEPRSRLEIRPSLYASLTAHDIFDYQSGLFKAFCDLQQISDFASCVPSSRIDKMDKALFADSIYAVELQLMFLSRVDDASCGSSLKGFITRACAMAAHTYLYVAPRQLMLNAPLFDTFVSQLKDALYDSRLLSTWQRLNPSLLLWVLVVGGCTAIERPEWNWFVRAIAKVAKYSRVSTLKQLRGVLESLIWYRDPFDYALTALWSGVETGFQRYAYPVRTIMVNHSLQ